MERLISFVGFLTILGGVYAFSKHRRAVNFRTIAWGLSLQILLALIILGRDLVSFCGLFLLFFLVVLYIFEEELRQKLGPWMVGILTFVGSAAFVALFYFLAPYRVTQVLLGLALVTFVVALKLGRSHLVHPSFAAVLLLGLAELWSRGIDGRTLFQLLAERVAAFLALSNQGSQFLFGNLARSEYFFPGSEFWPGFGFQFAFVVLPTIIFFSAFISILYYFGVVQLVIGAMARFMRWSMRTSGSETVSCTGNIFLGQTEAPFLVKPFLPTMTISELHAVMVGGFATIAGGVLAGYIQMGVDPGHLIAASVMAAPAALVVSKLLYPETEESVTAGDVGMPEIETADNVVGAAANGVTDGLKLAANVGAMLVAFIALIAAVDMFLGFFDRLIDGNLLKGALMEANGEYRGFFPGSLETFFGYLLRPMAFLMGVPWKDALAVGNLLGVKLSLNEFVSYGLLSEHIKAGDLSPRAITIATYALCGFANFSSIGIQIGGIGAIAPTRRADLARIGVRAMFGGAIASWLTATIAGVLL